MPTRPGFLQSKPKIDEAEWADTQARTVKRLHDFFAPDGVSSGEEPSEGADVDEERAEADAPTGSGREAAHDLPRPIIVYSSGAAVAEVPQIEVYVAPEGPGDDPDAGQPDTERRQQGAEAGQSGVEGGQTEAEVGPSRLVGVMATAEDALGWDVEPKAGVGVFDPRPVRKKVPKARPAEKKLAQSVAAAVAHCPYCAVLLDPAPTTNKRCVRCRHRIMVKKVDGAAVYLTEAAVQVFDAERRRIANTARWTRERDRWLRLSKAVGAPNGRRSQLALARLSDDVVAAAQKLYLTAADRAFRAARQDHDWVTAARLRRDKALALYGAAGSPVPPPADLVEIYREGVAAELRGLSEISREAELVSGSCCDACRAEEGLVFRIAKELRLPRLPHTACPRGLCRCHWNIAARDRVTMRRYLRRHAGPE